MARFLFAMLLALVAATAFDVPQAQAISRNNPYRSFNVSGVNYASMQWESKHGRHTNKSWSNARSSRRFFRGR